MMLAAALCLAALAGLIVWRDDGIASRAFAASYAEISAAIDDWTFLGVPIRDGNLVPAVERGSTDHYVVFLGDSHMNQYWPRLDLLYRSQHPPSLGAIFATIEGCPPFLDSEKRASGGSLPCDEWEARAFTFAHGPNVASVVFGASWKYYQSYLPRALPGFGRAIADFVASGKPVTVILQTPGGDEFDPRQMLGNRWPLLLAEGRSLPDRDAERLTAIDLTLDRRVAQVARENGAAVIDPADYLCSAEACPFLIEGDPLYLDGAHIRAKTARERATFMDHFVLHQ